MVDRIRRAGAVSWAVCGIAAVVALLGLIVLGKALSPYFLSADNFSNLVAALMEVAIMPLPLTLIIIMGAFMFFASRRQRKAMQATIDLQESLRVGDRVHTTSGLQGTIAGITDDAVDLEIAPGVVTRWMKLAVRDRVEPELAEADETGATSRGVELTDTDADRLPRD